VIVIVIVIVMMFGIVIIMHVGHSAARHRLRTLAAVAAPAYSMPSHS
jgi:hypothetical protein